MFWKVVQESFLRPGRRRRALWAMLAVALGTAVAAAMLHVSLDIGDKMGRELRTLGANIVVTHRRIRCLSRSAALIIVPCRKAPILRNRLSPS